MKRRIISVLLVLVMALTLLPTAAFATGEDVAAPAERQEPVCVCEAACTEEAMNADCPICGAEGAHTHDCARYQDGEKPVVSGAAQPGAEPEKQPEGEEKPQPETPDAAQPDTGAPDADEPEEPAAQEDTAVQSGDQGIALLAENGHTHCYCGGNVTAGDHTDHSKSITYKVCTRENSLRQIFSIEEVDVAYAYLANNMTLDYFFRIKEGQTLYLCLNGHTLNLGEYNILLDGEGATLYLCDCSADKTGTIDRNGGKTCCVLISGEAATFNMYGGTLKGSNTTKGGGAKVDKGTMNLYGGTITENTATSDGGGIYVGVNGTLNLYGGTISGNKVETNEGHYGGGVYVESNEWSGVGKISISGSPVITGNIRTITIDSKATTTTDNLYLQYAFYNKGVLPTIELGTLTDGAYIGIWAGESVFSNVSGKDYSKYFSSDKDGYHVEYNAEKKLVLVPGAATPTFTLIFNANGGEGAPDKLTNKSGNSFTVPNTKPTKTGYDFVGWALTDTAAEAAYQPGAAVTIASSNSMILYAVWKAHDFTAETAGEQYLKTGSSCTEKAVYYKSCTVCGLSSKGTASEATFESGNILGHVWGAWTSNDNFTHTRTCSRDASHTETGRCSFSEATCIARAKCNVCKAEYGETNPHNHAGTLGGWQSDENNHWKGYPCCDAKDGMDAHTWDSGTVTKQPTCTKAGEKTFTCNECGRKKTETMSATGHTFTAETVDAKYLKSGSSCTEKAVYYKSCTACGLSSAGTASEATFASGNVLGHDFTAEKAEEQYLKSAATCTAKAVYYKSCTVCGLSSKGDKNEATFEYGNVLGHDWGAWKQNSDGSTHTRICKRDDKHTETKDCSGGEATCTAKAKCKDCNAEYGGLAPDNHSDLRHVEAKDATTSAEGNIEYWYCAGCGKYYKDAAAKNEIRKEDTVIPKKPRVTPNPVKNPYQKDGGKKTDGKTIQSGKTGDSGVALYAAMALLSLTGGAWTVGRKRR